MTNQDIAHTAGLGALVDWADPDWRVQALCLDPYLADEVFYGEEKNHARAKSYCLECPVLPQCFEDTEAAERGLQSSSLFGVRAGETPSERHLRRVRTGQLHARGTETHCGRGHEYNEANTRYTDGSRRCRVCDRERRRQ